MSTLKLDDIKATAERKYGPVIIELGDGQSVTLRQALRLPSDERKKVAELEKAMQAIDQTADDTIEQMIDNLGEILRVAATNRDDADRLLEQVGNDLPVLMQVFHDYGKASELPEA